LSHRGEEGCTRGARYPWPSGTHPKADIAIKHSQRSQPCHRKQQRADLPQPEQPIQQAAEQQQQGGAWDGRGQRGRGSYLAR
jgi:hypothetical protein